MLRADPLSVSACRDSGFMRVTSTHSAKAFNPCPLTAPSLHGFPLYMDMFCFSSFFLLAALSVAQRGTYSLFIGTYLGKGRNPMFLSNPYSLPQPLPLLSGLTCITLSILAFYPILLFISSSCRGGISLIQYAFILCMLSLCENLDGKLEAKKKKKSPFLIKPEAFQTRCMWYVCQCVSLVFLTMFGQTWPWSLSGYV